MQVGNAESGVAGLPHETQKLTCANPIPGSETCGVGTEMRAVEPDPVVTDQAHESTATRVQACRDSGSSDRLGSWLRRPPRRFTRYPVGT
jgi:hypothetical protein